MRLDQLEALVEERRRVDRDPPAHLPGRVRERLGDRDLGQILALAERAARSGQDQRSDRAGAALAVDQLVERRVLGVDRDDRGAGGLGERGDERAADDQALLVREREVDALGERDDRRAEAGRAGDRVQDEVGVRGRDRARGRPPPRRGRPDARVAHRSAAAGSAIATRGTSSLLGLVARLLPARMRRDPDQLEGRRRPPGSPPAPARRSSRWSRVRRPSSRQRGY